MNGFEKLLEKEIEYNMYDVRNWFSFNQQKSKLEDNIIDEISECRNLFTPTSKNPEKHDLFDQKIW